MRYLVSGKNIEVTAALREIAISKISKLDKFFADDTDAHITLSVQKQIHIVEVTIPIKGSVIRAEEREENMYAAIDLVVDILERQLMKHKEKLVDRHRHNGSFKNEYLELSADDDFDGVQIVRTKKFAVKPMDPEEACMEMELLGHDFFVFRNSETEEVNVVYKRKGANYGLIEPEV